MRVVGVTGTRDNCCRGIVSAELDALKLSSSDMIVIGACPTGVDYEAECWAKRHGVQPLLMPALWDYYSKLGRSKSAGNRRNEFIARVCGALRAETVIAVPCVHSRGTHDCVERVGNWKVPFRYAGPFASSTGERL